MNLNKIEGPEFLKDLSIKELNSLAEDIRTFLIDSISKTGGHLSSNLGIVELTIALHRVFNSPYDKIFFDVGHQSYVHKILTGRGKYFNTLRQFNGLSGFQKRHESKHDPWEAGHSSTALSGALGMAIARDLNNEDYFVIPVVGDGAMSSGMSLEALNQIGSEQRKMIIIFNDNNMSISKNVGSLTNTSFARLRTSKPYTHLKEDVKEVLQSNKLGDKLLKGMISIKEAIKDGVVDSGVFGEFNLDYLGPVDGHNIKDLIRVLEVAKEKEGPVVVHVITKKGKGYSFCENDSQGKWHGIAAFNKETGKLLKDSLPNFESWSSVISNTLIRLADQNKDIIAITPAMIGGSKLEKFFAKYPERSFDCGIAEEHATTFAAGLAISGKRPFLSIYSSFLQRAYDQINHDLCRMQLPCVIGIDRAGLVGEDGPTHHGVFDIGILRNIPHIILAEPKDAYEAQDMMYTAFKNNSVFAIRYPRGNVEYHEKNFETIKIGSWTKEKFDINNKVTVLTYGNDVCIIKEKLDINNMPVNLINCRFFKPLDYEMLNELSKLNTKIIIYETDVLSGGLSSAILEYMIDSDLNLDIKRIGIKDEFAPQGALNQIRKALNIDLEYLFEVINSYL